LTAPCSAMPRAACLPGIFRPWPHLQVSQIVVLSHRLRIFAAAAASSSAAATYCASLAGPPVYPSHRRRDILVKSAISAAVTSYPTLSRHSSAATRLEKCSPPAGLFYQILLILPPAHFILPPLPQLREASRIC
jgi:hypothetical protein